MKLTYFTLRARGECSRLMLAHVHGEDWEEERVTFEEWPNRKADAKWGFLPVMVDGDVSLGQSGSVQKHIALKNGLAGKTNLEKYQVDLIIDTFDDIFNPFPKTIFGKDDEEKAKALEEFKAGIPDRLSFLEKVKTMNGEGHEGNFMVGQDLTLADFRVADFLFFLAHIGEKCPVDLKTHCPGLLSVHDHVNELPNVKKYIASRPESDI